MVKMKLSATPTPFEFKASRPALGLKLDPNSPLSGNLPKKRRAPLNRLPEHSHCVGPEIHTLCKRPEFTSFWKSASFKTPIEPGIPKSDLMRHNPSYVPGQDIDRRFIHQRKSDHLKLRAPHTSSEIGGGRFGEAPHPTSGIERWTGSHELGLAPESVVPEVTRKQCVGGERRYMSLAITVKLRGRSLTVRE
jgi:hypothetical protein